MSKQFNQNLFDLVELMPVIVPTDVNQLLSANS